MEKVPRICSFRGARQEVMERVWKKAGELESKGIPLSHEVFGLLIRDEWKKVKEEAIKVCPIVSIEEIRKILGEKVEGSETSTTISESGRPIEAKIGVSIRTQELGEEK